MSSAPPNVAMPLRPSVSTTVAVEPSAVGDGAAMDTLCATSPSIAAATSVCANRYSPATESPTDSRSANDSRTVSASSFSRSVTTPVVSSGRSSSVPDGNAVSAAPPLSAKSSGARVVGTLPLMALHCSGTSSMRMPPPSSMLKVASPPSANSSAAAVAVMMVGSLSARVMRHSPGGSPSLGPRTMTGPALSAGASPKRMTTVCEPSL